MNLSETFRIDVNMDFAHTNHSPIFDLGLAKKKFEPKKKFVAQNLWPTHISKLCSHKNQG